MKWLVCVSVDGGEVFSVEIEEAKTICELKNVLKEKNPSIITCAAEELTLYVAKYYDEWFKLKDSDLNQLKQSKVPEEVGDVLKRKEMDPVNTVGSTTFGFPDADEAKDGDFHILVDAHRALGLKRKRYVHSEMTKETTNRLLQDLHIQMTVSPTVAISAEPDANVEEFKWDCDSDETTKKLRERYHAYLEQHIGNVLEEKDLCVLGVEEEEDLLDVGLPGYNMNLAGHTDVLILDSIMREQPTNLHLMQDVRMLVNVNREMDENYVFQAASELIALDLLSNDPVMALLTNLINVWHFFWVSERNDDNQVLIEHAMTTKPDAAFKIIMSLLAQASDTDVADMKLPCIQTPVKRRKLDRMLPSIRVNSGALIQQYDDATRESGPNVELARSIGYQVTINRSIPAFRKFA